MKTAIIEKIHTVEGNYALPDNRWDSLPEWTYWDACIIRVKAIGKIKWGPLIYRKNSKKEHRGIFKIEVEENKIFGRDNYEKRADDYLLEAGIKLEEKGYEIKLREYTNKNSQDLRKKVKYIERKPPKWAIKRIKTPTIEALI